MYRGCSMMMAYLAVAAKSWTQAGLMGCLSATKATCTGTRSPETHAVIE
jgi:hypothetical protein